MQDRRQHILETAIALVREQGLAALTQPRIARRSGLRQSHLTYYYPTRVHLLESTAEAAVDSMLAEIDRSLRGKTVRSIARGIAGVAIRPDNTRLLLALVQVADEVPTVRAAFQRLAAGIAQRAGARLREAVPEVDPENVRLLHAVTVGLAVIHLATGEPQGDGTCRAARSIERTLRHLFRSGAG